MVQATDARQQMDARQQEEQQHGGFFGDQRVQRYAMTGGAGALGATAGGVAGTAAGGAVGAAGGGIIGWGVGMTTGTLFGFILGMFMGLYIARADSGMRPERIGRLRFR